MHSIQQMYSFQQKLNILYDEYYVHFVYLFYDCRYYILLSFLTWFLLLHFSILLESSNLSEQDTIDEGRTFVRMQYKA